MQFARSKTFISLAFKFKLGVEASTNFKTIGSKRSTPRSGIPFANIGIVSCADFFKHFESSTLHLVRNDTEKENSRT